MTPEDSRFMPSRSLSRSILKGLPVILLVSLVVHVSHHGIWLFPFESATLDALILLKPVDKSNHIVLVVITDNDYLNLFNERSPLDLQRLESLLAAVAAGQPSVIGVDLDTSARGFRNWRARSWGVPVVWARDALVSFQGQSEHAVLRPLPVLGADAGPLLTGLALFPQDADGIVRRYVRCFATSEGLKPSFTWSLVAAARGETGDCQEGKDRILNFAAGKFRFDRVNARDVLTGARGKAWSTQGPLRNKIVILGGSYHAARDEYVTPVGMMGGVDLTATALESDLEDRGIEAADKGWLVVVEMVVGLLIVVAHHSLPPRRAVLMSLIAIPLGALLASLIAFSTFAYWINSVPVLAAVLIHQLYESIQHYRSVLRYNQNLLRPRPRREPRPKQDYGVPTWLSLSVAAIVLLVASRVSPFRRR
jgi:CHASE2 domain-containing sensor protein